MTTILITGAQGQLGTELGLLLAKNNNFRTLLTDVDQLDITDSFAIHRFFASHDIDVVVNCAAYTAVDRAEDDAYHAQLLNTTAPQLLARACAQNGAKMVHISTDYVFDGHHFLPYSETDNPQPQTVYGSTKLAGERAVAEALPNDHLIVRTSWLYSPFGHNFVKTMLALGRQKPQLTVVADQVGSPTYAADLAAAIITMINTQPWHCGTYHYSNEGVASWYDFAVAIHRLADIRTCFIAPCDTTDYPTAAQRPHYSVMSKNKVRTDFGLTIPHWEDSLQQCIYRILNS